MLTYISQNYEKLGAGFYLVHGLDDPIDARIAANGLMLRVDKDDLEILVGRVLVNPIGVQYPQISAAASHAFFGGRLE